ncbi:MAG TPA: tRNA (N(6)-L-threonylcarbamoyladenosine(37)-C(2))-methylthiotransferase MtaB [Bacteroidales bacterium]|nr:tRNA (N(6)-L-threonylcarbamoyladenosine(37)-C(2))-methylthiotransferase MtaB [Bacteroidales bacterium]
MKKKVAFQTLGCKLNFAETSTIARSFSDETFERVDPGSHADVFVINTCSVTDTADRKCRQAVRKIINHNPGAFIAVVGCYAQLRPEEAASIEGVDLVLGNNEKFDIVKYIDSLDKKSIAEVHSCEAVDNAGFNISWSAGDRTRTFLKVQDGCDYHCSYCTIPKARGNSRNPFIAEIVAEATSVTASGVKEIVLTGVNVGDFGKSTGETLEELLKSLIRIPGIERLRLSSIEPNLLTDSILMLMASEPVLMPHIHMPLQSGNDKILGLMRRRYKREAFSDRVSMIREHIPGASVGADVITGFPGETAEDFEDTFHFLEALPLTYLHVFSFSPRPGTPAASMPGMVAAAEKERRSRQLIRLSESRRTLFMQAASGDIADVLFEKRDPGGLIAGFTGNYIRTVVPYSEGLSGKVRRVKLTTLRDDSSMNGELIEN